LRRAVERTIKISVSNEEEMIDLMDTLCNRLGFVDLNMTYRPGMIKIQVRGSHNDVKRAIGLIREIISMSKRKARLKLLGINVFEAKELSKEAGMAISLELLAEALKMRGFNCRIIENRIETSANEDIVFEVARLIGLAYSNLRFETKSSSVKRLIALASSISGCDVWTTIDTAERINLLRRNDSGRLILIKDWRSALEELLEELKKIEEELFEDFVQ